MREHRRYERYPINVDVEVTIPRFLRKQRRRYRTRDMSDGGVFLESDGRPSPPVGTVIEIRVVGQVGGQAPPVVRARVVRVTADGMAVHFLSGPARK